MSCYLTIQTTSRAGREVCIPEVHGTKLRYYIKEGWDFTFFLDVVQEGNLELVRFINQYDPKSSIDFRQMAFWSISKAICNALGREEIEFKKRGESIEQLMKKLTEDREN